MAGLTLKQELFIEAYLGAAKGNATEAARRAGYAHPMQQGERLLRNVEIGKLVKARVESVKGVLSADDVLRELSECAGRGWDELGGIIEPKDKLKALELLGKHHKLFADRTVHEDPDGKALPVLNVILSGSTN